MVPGRANFRFSGGAELTYSDRYYDDKSVVQYSPGQLTRTTLILGLEYGLTRRVSLFAHLPYSFLNYQITDAGSLHRPDQLKTDPSANGRRYNKNGLADSLIGAAWEVLQVKGSHPGSYALIARVLVPSGDSRSSYHQPFTLHLGQGFMGLEGAAGGRQIILPKLGFDWEAGVRVYLPGESDAVVSVADVTHIPQRDLGVGPISIICGTDSAGNQLVCGNARVRPGREWFAQAGIEVEPQDFWTLGLGIRYFAKAETKYHDKIVYQVTRIDPAGGQTYADVTQANPLATIKNSDVEQLTVSPSFEYRLSRSLEALHTLRVMAELPAWGRNTDTLFPDYFNAFTLGIEWRAEY